jgi:hypothetical protein
LSISASTGILIVALDLVLAVPQAAGAATVVPVTTFTVTSSQCAGGVQSQTVQELQDELDGLLAPTGRGGITLPTISLNPGCTAAPSELSSLINASNTVSSSPGGSAIVSSEALGDTLLTEEAYADVRLTASIPLGSPASSVRVSIPYTTSGVTWTQNVDEAGAGVAIAPTSAPIMGVDGAYGTMAPYDETGVIAVTSLSIPTPPGSGTYTGIEFYCPDGSDLVSGLGFVVTVSTYVYSASGQTYSASANFQMQGVTATVDA